ncbi:MAG: MFS transporter, partial [Acidimicrobiales bacterium]
MTRARLAAGKTFRSLQVRNYRLFFFGQMVSLTGTWMQVVAQSWLVLELSRHSPIALSLTVALQFLPMLVFGVWGGVIADRLDKRRTLVWTQSAAGLLALVLWLLVLTGAVQLWMVYVLALLLGFVNVVDMPTRQAFVTEMVGPAEIANAVGLNGAVFNSARIVGPAVAGLVISAAGVGPTFLANAVSFLAPIGALLAMRKGDLFRSPPVPRRSGQIRAGIRYVRERPRLWSTLLLITVVSTLGFNFLVVLPLMAKVVFGGGARLYGWLQAVMAAGSLFGALAAAGRARPTRRLLLGSTV